jgi:hypothetical protein
MSGEALAGHAGDAGPLASLMPHEIGMAIAGLVVIVLTLCVLLSLALRRISRLERRVTSIEDARLARGQTPPQPPQG